MDKKEGWGESGRTKSHSSPKYPDLLHSSRENGLLNTARSLSHRHKPSASPLGLPSPSSPRLLSLKKKHQAILKPWPETASGKLCSCLCSNSNQTSAAGAATARVQEIHPGLYNRTRGSPPLCCYKKHTVWSLLLLDHIDEYYLRQLKEALSQNHPQSPHVLLSVHSVVLVVVQLLTMLRIRNQTTSQAPEFRACLICGLAEAPFLPCGNATWKEMGCRGGDGWGAKERLEISRSQGSWGRYSHVLGSIGVQFWKTVGPSPGPWAPRGWSPS